MKKTSTKSLAWLLSLAMIVSMMTAAMIPVWAEETPPDAETGTEPVASSEAIPAEISMTTPDFAVVNAVKGQEYAIAPKGSEPDWTKAVDPLQYEEDTTYYVEFKGLTPAETYVVYTRIKGSEGTPATTEVTLALESVGIDSDKGDVVGSTFTAEPDPNPEGLTFQWFYDEFSEGEEGAIQHKYTAIEGATSASYTVKPEDLGKYISVSVYNKYGNEVMDHSSEHGPMTAGDLFEGTWVEKFAHRATMEITPTETGYTLNVTWPGSAFERELWEIPDGVYDEEKDQITYKEGKMTIQKFAEDGSHEDTVVSTKESGTITIKDGELNWLRNSDDPELKDPVVFEKTSVEPVDPTPAALPFTDISEEDYFYTPVMWAVRHDPQITNGTSETTFSPDQNCTRGQVVTFLWRAAGCPEPTSTENKFTDVTDQDYFYKAVLWAVEKKITNGMTETTFGPEQSCTRGQVAAFLWRAAESPEPASSENAFTDVTDKDYFYKAVLWAVENDITKGTGEGLFSPNQTCTRGQIVTFLYRSE